MTLLDDIRRMDDGTLNEACRAAERVRDAALAEAARRDRAGKQARDRAAETAAWRDAAHAQYLAAERECRGVLLSRAASETGIDPWSLWSGPEARALFFASPELRDFWAVNPRLTITEYRKQAARDRRLARAAAREEQEHGQRDDRAVMAGPETGGLRRDADPCEVPQGSAGPVPGDGRAAGEDAGPAASGHGSGTGPVQQPGRAVTAAPGPGRAAEVAARAAGYLETGRQAVETARRVIEPVPAPAAPAVPGGAGLVPAGGVIDGKRWLNLAGRWHARHVWMSDTARVAAVLYVAAQHFRLPGETRRMAWPKFGNFLFVADEHGSGKTTAMKLMGYLAAPYYIGIDADPTARGLCYSIRDEHAFLCLDEMHRCVGTRGTRKADVITILNLGLDEDGSYLNGTGGKATRVNVYAPVVMAGKSGLVKAAREEIGDLIDRCAAVVTMVKPPAYGDDGQPVELEEVTGRTRGDGALIAARLAAWAGQEMADEARFAEAFTAAAAAAKGIGLAGRAKDVWVPLLAVAWLADKRIEAETEAAGEDMHGALNAALSAAAEFRLKRPPVVAGCTDPLEELEASLAGGRLAPSFG